MYAHRAAWEFFYGPVPADMQVLHRCDTPPCVRPDHLFLGTQVENMADCQGKGRLAIGWKAGEAHPRARLTDEDVAEIRREYAAGMRPVEIARRWKLSYSHAWSLAKGRTRPG